VAIELWECQSGRSLQTLELNFWGTVPVQCPICGHPPVDVKDKMRRNQKLPGQSPGNTWKKAVKTRNNKGNYQVLHRESARCLLSVFAFLSSKAASSPTVLTTAREEDEWDNTSYGLASSSSTTSESVCPRTIASLLPSRDK
jgi:hypothetical protein